MAPPDMQTAVVVTRLRVMKVDEYVDEWADLEVQQRPVPKPQKGQVGSFCCESIRSRARSPTRTHWHDCHLLRIDLEMRHDTRRALLLRMHAAARSVNI